MIVNIVGFFAILILLMVLHINEAWIWPPFALFLIIRYWDKLVGAYYHGFVKYPMSMEPDVDDVRTKSTRSYEQDANAKRIITDKIKAEAEIAEAVLRRERARAALEDADKELKAAERREAPR
jgi:hypothetical protein